MLGYWNNLEATSQAIDAARWMHTGDLATMDDEGYLNIVGRIKDMIIRGGENIYPKEIETVVYQLPEIAEAAVVGRAHQIYGEEPVLFVSLNSGAAITTERIQDHLRESLSKFKHPAEITILDDLPKNPVGKIDKPTLRRSIAEVRR